MPNFELPRAARHAFSLIELLVVVAIISILVGMVSVAASSARQNAYRARAQAEVRELSNALKAYWITYGFWPPEIESAWTSENSPIEMTRNLLASLRGKGNTSGTADGENTRQIVFLEISDQQFEQALQRYKVDAFVDPWGSPYRVYLSKSTDAALPAQEFFFFTAVPFPMRNRYP